MADPGRVAGAGGDGAVKVCNESAKAGAFEPV